MIIHINLEAAGETPVKTKETKQMLKKMMKMMLKIERWKPFQIHLVFMKMICKNGIRNLLRILKKEK
jgi:hypothetical protein